MVARYEKISVDQQRDSSFFVPRTFSVGFRCALAFYPGYELTLILESRSQRFVSDSIEPF